MVRSGEATAWGEVVNWENRVHAGFHNFSEELTAASVVHFLHREHDEELGAQKNQEDY